MSTQSNLIEFAEKVDSQTGRQICGAERYDGGECRSPGIPGLGVCAKHVESTLQKDEKETGETEDAPVWERHRDELLEGDD